MGCTWPLKNYSKVWIILLITLKIRKVLCQKDNFRFRNEKTNLCFYSSFHPLVFFLASLLWTVSVSDSGVKPFHDKGSDRRPSPLFSPPTSTLETRPQGASSSILPPSGLIESCSKCDKYTLQPHVKPYRVPNNVLWSDLWHRNSQIEESSTRLFHWRVCVFFCFNDGNISQFYFESLAEMSHLHMKEKQKMCIWTHRNKVDSQIVVSAVCGGWRRPHGCVWNRANLTLTTVQAENDWSLLTVRNNRQM